MGTSYSNSSIPMHRDYQQYRAPKQNNRALVEPETTELLQLAKHRNETYRTEGASKEACSLTLAGVPQFELMRIARTELVEMAYGYTKSYAEDLPTWLSSYKDQPLILSGHQPELFHPGVWFKNFGLDHLAKSIDAFGIHLLIDSDLCRDVAVRVPKNHADKLHLESIAFDQVQPPVPFEERQIANQEVFSTFTDRVNENSAVEREPMLDNLWVKAQAAVSKGKKLGEALSQARHQIERSHGSQTLELPLSKVCDTGSFRSYIVEILSRIETFHEAYNGALDRYRKAHRLRSEAQPLPNLESFSDAASDDQPWLETPFWAGSIHEPIRRKLWCSRKGKQMLLSNQPAKSNESNQWQAVLDIDRPDVATQQLKACREEGIKIRSRALTTTLYCRHFLADLFLHGIGGAKYDQVTDDLSQQFFGIAPPPHATLTATVRLFDVKPHEPKQSKVTELEQRLRSYRYHPERWLEERRPLSEAEEAAIESKKRWIQTEKRSENASQRHQAIEQANQVLYDSLQSERDKTEQELARLLIALREAPFYTSREYSFGLFAEKQLIGRLQSLARSN